MRDLQLVYSILIVSISGALKLAFAYGFLGSSVPVCQLLAAGLITFAAYAFDRGIENKEDEKRDVFFRKSLLFMAVISIIASFILVPNPALAIPFVIAYLYTKGIFGHRLKGGLGGKNAVVAFTWSLGTVIFIGMSSIAAILVYAFLFLKSFVNTIIYDVRDIDKDRSAGIRTIPVVMNSKRLIRLLITITLISHGILLLAFTEGMITFPDVIILSCVHSIIYIAIYCNRFDSFRNTLVDGEWILYGIYSVFRHLVL